MKLSSPFFKLFTKYCDFHWDYACQLSSDSLKFKNFEAPISSGQIGISHFIFPLMLQAQL